MTTMSYWGKELQHCLECLWRGVCVPMYSWFHRRSMHCNGGCSTDTLSRRTGWEQVTAFHKHFGHFSLAGEVKRLVSGVCMKYLEFENYLEVWISQEPRDCLH